MGQREAGTVANIVNVCVFITGLRTSNMSLPASGDEERTALLLLAPSPPSSLPSHTLARRMRL